MRWEQILSGFERKTSVGYGPHCVIKQMAEVDRKDEPSSVINNQDIEEKDKLPRGLSSYRAQLSDEKVTPRQHHRNLKLCV